jgi:hypothetical protein
MQATCHVCKIILLIMKFWKREKRLMFCRLNVVHKYFYAYFACLTRLNKKKDASVYATVTTLYYEGNWYCATNIFSANFSPRWKTARELAENDFLQPFTQER